MVSNEKEAESSHSSKLEPGDSGRQTCIGTVIVSSEAGGCSRGAGERGSWEPRPVPLGIGRRTGFEQGGKVEDCPLREGSGLRDGRTSWGGAGPGQRPLLHSETRKLVTIMEQFINRVPLPAPGPSPTGDDPTNWF